MNAVCVSSATPDLRDDDFAALLGRGMGNHFNYFVVFGLAVIIFLE